MSYVLPKEAVLFSRNLSRPSLPCSARRHVVAFSLPLRASRRDAPFLVPRLPCRAVGSMVSVQDARETSAEARTDVCKLHSVGVGREEQEVAPHILRWLPLSSSISTPSLSLSVGQKRMSLAQLALIVPVVFVVGSFRQELCFVLPSHPSSHADRQSKPSRTTGIVWNWRG